MIVVKLIGGLGNQMFQYAVGRYLSELNKTELFLDVSSLLNRSHDNYIHRDFELSALNHKAQIANEDIIKGFFYLPEGILAKLKYKLKKLLFGLEILKEHSFEFQNVLDKKGYLYLDGFWQSELYFRDISSIIQEEFSFKQPPMGKNSELVEKINNQNSISIHIRRGDYANKPETNQHHGLCSLDYYKDAIEIIKTKVEKPSFYIFSDEPEWVQENFIKDINYQLISHNKGAQSFEDMRLMSSCKHNIIANSSFSWWGAWLNRNPLKTVIAPSKWFNNSSVNTKDLFPSNWIKI